MVVLDHIPRTSPGPPPPTAAKDMTTLMAVSLHDVLEGGPGSVLDERDRGADSRRPGADIRAAASGASAAALENSWSGHSEVTGEADVQASEELPVMAS